MNRRQFLKATAAGTTVACMASAQQLLAATPDGEKTGPKNGTTITP